MGLIPRVFLDELLHQTDIVSLIDDYIPLKKQGTTFVACCPFHQEKTPSFNVIPKKQFYHCFGCGAHGNAISFIIEYLKQPFPLAIETLAARAGLAVPKDPSEQQLKTSFDALNQQLLACATFYHQYLLSASGQIAQTYLKQRHIQPETIQRFQLGYAPEGWHTLEKLARLSNTQDLLTTGMLIPKDAPQQGHYDRYRHRLMFPIHNKQGKIIGFGGRALDSTQKPKYLNSPETPIFHKSKELYGLYQLLQHDPHPPFILVVEGYMDVITLVQAGIIAAVATLGTSVQSSHLNRLSHYTQHIIFCFDGDSAGQTAAWRGLQQCLSILNSALQCSFIFLPPEHDPDSFIRTFGPERFLESIEHAMPWSTFLIKTLTKDINVQTIAGKNQFLHQIKPYLEQIPESPNKTLLLQDISRMTHLDPVLLTQQLTAKTDKKRLTTSSLTHTLSIKRTPLRIAIALLLQHPDEYKKIAMDFPPERFIKDISLRPLSTLMNLIIKQQTPNSASLIESFRDNEFFESMQKLALWDLALDATRIHHEMKQTLQFIFKEQEKKEVNLLIEKSKNIGLDKNEQLRLQVLLKQIKTSSILSE